MCNLIKGEFYKLRKSKLPIGMIFLSLVAAFFMMSHYDDNMRRLKGVDPEIIGGMYSIKYSFECIIFTSYIFSLFAGQFIAKDLKENISKSFIYGYKRGKVIVSKLIVFMIFSLIIELIYTAILVYYGRSYWFDYNITNILYLIRIIFIGTLYNLATISIIAMIAIVTKSNIITVISPMLFLMPIIILAYKSYVPSMLAFIFPFISAEGAIDRFATIQDIIVGLMSSVLVLIIAIGGSLLHIKYEDIK